MNTETLRTICLELPAVTEDIKWEKDLVFSIGGKMFCVTSFDEPFKASFKVPDADFEDLSSREGFIPAPYMARAKWVMVSNDAALSKQEWTSYIKQSHELVSKGLTRKLRKELGLPE
ncbi:MmcQ/YjbR family DNA-binding protein [Flavisolibacter sp. BT320]|nr:MmcQ/YjbR family DNA-binding protein [Flavisolibacter longurius]